MSMDDRRMRLARDELFNHLDKDTCSIMISYAQYTEAELVLIALHNKIEYNGGFGYKIYKTYCTKPIDADDPNDIFNRNVYVNHMWICNDGRCHPTHRNSHVEPPLFTLGFGKNDRTFGRIPITLNDLLPTSGMKINVRGELVGILDICRPIYLANIQSEIDAI